MLNVLEQLELAVRPLREHGRAEGLHDLLDRRGRAGELVLRRAAHMRPSDPPAEKIRECGMGHTRRDRRPLWAIRAAVS